MRTHNYRTTASPYERITQPEVEVGAVVRVTLPEPPAFNAMIELAKRRTRKFGKTYLKKAMPLYYLEQQVYQSSARAALDAAGWRRPATPWEQWSIVRIEFRLWSLRDMVELCSSMKWPVDVLVQEGFVADDSPAHLHLLCLPTQTVHREQRGVDLWIRRDA